MVTAYYLIMLAIAVALMICYLFIWHKHFDMHITLIFVLVPISNLGYTMVAFAPTLEVAITATKVSYIGGCYLILLLMFAVFGLCKIKISRWVRIALLCLCTGLYIAVLTIGFSDLYYVSADLKTVDGASYLDKQYGPLHTLFIVTEICLICATFAAVFYSYLRKNQVSRKNLHLLLITDSAIDSLVQTGATGFASFDFKYNYLGSNETAKNVIPQFNELTVDKPIASNDFMRDTALPWLKAFTADQTQSEFHFEKGDRIYQIDVQYLYSGKRKRGYQFFITDDTEDQNYIKLLNSFNTELQLEVDKKTAHIVEMHDNLVLSMAVMVESRDNSTGGHIRRTSEGVRILVAQMRSSAAEGTAADGLAEVLTDSFCRNVAKAAPMHDLGKIAVDDAILCKPGRFTPEEFEKMKAHSAEGARIVHEILKGTDDDEFRRIAENVAHYHHERWDGSGYPEGLSGEAIPLEARIMAIADVYDALVSKRVYKEAMPFDKADAIIMEGMGSQFDKSLEPYYVAARPLLEQYYLDQE